MNPISPYNPSITALPKEVLELTCHYLDAQDVVHLASTDKKFYFLASTDPLSAPLWNLLLRKDFPTSYTRLKTEAASLDFYKGLGRIERNMKHGKCLLHTLSREQGLTFHHILILYFAIWNDRLISFPCVPPSRSEGTVRVWNLKTATEEKSLSLTKSRGTLIKCARIVNSDLILSVSKGWRKKGKIEIWDLNHVGKEPRILKGHRGEVRYIKSVNDTLISGSFDEGRGDGEIKFWDFKSGQNLGELSVPNGLSCIDITGDGKIIYGSGDGTIRIWDLKAGKQIRDLKAGQGSFEWIKSTKDKLIISGAEDGTIKVWDLKTGKQLQTLTGGHGSITCMKIVGEKLIFGAEDGTIKIWDFTAGKQLQDLVGGQGSITCLKILDKFIVSGSSKGAIKIWDLHTGKQLQEFLGNPSWISGMKIAEGKFFSSRINGALEIRDFIPRPAEKCE